MNKVILTYEKESGEECVTSGSFPLAKDDVEIIQSVHHNDVLKQKGQYIMDYVNKHGGSPNIKSLGYVVDTMPKFRSRLTNVQVRRGPQWEKALRKAILKINY
jgi:hypothetical protein